MRVHIETGAAEKNFETRVGNVYACGGGRSSGKMMIVMHITEPEKYDGSKALMLVINRQGAICNVTSYSVSYLDDKCPIAFVKGITDVDLTMVSI
jgi:hypothetical protein